MNQHVVVIALATLATTGYAETRPAAALSWTRLPGAERCIDAPGLARAVEARIGDVLVTPAHAELSIEGRIAPRAGRGWRAVVVVAHANGGSTSQRAIETASSDCRSLDTSLALVIALLVDPTGSPTGSKAPTPATAPEVVIREIHVPILVRPPWQIALALRASGEWKALAHLTEGGELALVVTPPGLWQVELVGFVDRSVETAADLPGRSVTESFAGGAVAVCPGWPLGGVRASACGGVRIARLGFQGHDFDQDFDGSALLPALVGDARIELPIGKRMHVTASAGVRVPLRRIELAYDRSDSAGGGEITVDRTAPASIALAVGIVARLL